MFRTSTYETKKQKPTTRGGPRGFPIQLLCLTSVIGREPVYSAWYSGRRKMTRLKRTFRRPFRDEKGGRYSFIYFLHYSEQWIGDGTKSWKEAKNTVSIPLAFVQYTAARKRVCLHSHFVMATPDSHRQMHRRTFWRSTGGKVVTPVHPMLQPPCRRAVFEIGGNTL